MNTLQFFSQHHHRLYFAQGGLFDRLNGLTEAQIRNSPNGQNSIAWLLWHIARCEDVGINRMVTDGIQVFDNNRWIEKLNIDRKDIGTGMSFLEVQNFSDQINIKELLNYLQEVINKSEEVSLLLSENVLDEFLTEKYLYKVLFEEEIVGKDDTNVINVYKDKSKGWFLGHLGLTHAKGHLSQILIIRKLQGLGSGGL
jgi:hypothetical protein